MDSQDPLIPSVTNANEEDVKNDPIEPTVEAPAIKSRLLMMEPALILLFFGWSVTGNAMSFDEELNGLDNSLIVLPDVS